MQLMKATETLSIVERIRMARESRWNQVKNYYAWSSSDLEKEQNQHCRKVQFVPNVTVIDSIISGDFKELKALIDSGADPNCAPYDDLTALHHCCIEGHIEMAHLLILKGAEVNAKDMDGWTPMHAAAMCGYKEIVELLVCNGGDMMAKNNDGEIPFQMTTDADTLYFLERELLKQDVRKDYIKALTQDDYAILKQDIERLITDGEDINISVTKENGTLLHVAISHYYNDLVKVLLLNGASDETVDSNGWRPIHAAAFWENETALQLLMLERDTDVSATTYEGQTPYDLCETSSLQEYILEKLHEQNKRKSRSSQEKLSNLSDQLTGDGFPSNQEFPTAFLFNPKGYLNNSTNPENAENETYMDLQEIISSNYLLFNPKMNETLKGKKSSFLKEAKRQMPLVRLNSNESNQNGEPHTKSGEPHTKSEEPHIKSGEPHTKSGEAHTKSGEAHTKNGEPHTKSGEPHTKSEEPHTKSGEPHTKSEEPHTKSREPHTKSGGAHTKSREPHTKSEQLQSKAQNEVVDSKINGNIQSKVTKISKKTSKIKTNVELPEQDFQSVDITAEAILTSILGLPTEPKYDSFSNGLEDALKTVTTSKLNSCNATNYSHKLKALDRSISSTEYTQSIQHGPDWQNNERDEGKIIEEKIHHSNQYLANTNDQSTEAKQNCKKEIKPKTLPRNSLFMLKQQRKGDRNFKIHSLSSTEDHRNTSGKDLDMDNVSEYAIQQYTQNNNCILV